MSNIEWVENYTLGITEIDNQHKELVAITDRLFQAIMDDKGEEVLLETLKAIADYATYHFDFEESLLREHDFPHAELEEHIAEHDKLKSQVAEFIEEYSMNPSAMDVSLFGFLRSWTDEHMRQTDSGYVHYLLQRGVR